MIEILKNIKSIFLSSSLWNVSFPFILGLFLNYNLSDSRTLVIYFIWLPILSLPYIISKFRVFILLVWIPSIAFGLLDLIHWVSIKAPVSIYSLFVMFETNAREALSFANLKFSYLYILLPIYIFISFFLLIKDFRIKPKYKLKPVVFVVLISVVFMTENYLNDRFIRKATPFVFHAVGAFYEEIEAYKKVAENIETFVDKINATAIDTKEEQITVIIVGESTNRNRMSIYGYQRETSHLLAKRNDILAYSNVISAYTHTLLSVRTSLTASNIENGIANTKSPSIIEVARAAKFKTFWISNQGAVGMFDNLIALMARSSNEVIFVNKILESNRLLGSYSYDGKVLEPFKKVLEDNAKRKFIVVHLLGTHATYSKRYPDDFEYFKREEDEKLRLISEYDNAVRYNDYIVNSIIELLKTHSVNSHALSNLVYISDHGDVVYDDNIQVLGHDWKELPPRHLVEIPFIVWQSEYLKDKFPQLDSLMINNIDRPFCTDNLFHAAIDLMHIKTDLLVDSLSVFNLKFKDRERIIVDGISYENEILKSHFKKEKDE